MKVIHKIIIPTFIITALLAINSVSAISFQSSELVSFTFNPTVQITISDNLTIPSLSPGDSKDSNIITVTASSNSIAGYTLSSSVGSISNPSTELRKDGTSTTHKFDSIITNKSSLSDFSGNDWGYSYSTDSGTTWQSGDITGTPATGYNGLPLYTTETPIKLINSNDASTNSIQFKIGAKATSTQVAGEYTNVINFIGVANANPEPVYMQNWNNCSAMAIGDVVTLVDNRDYQTYLVGKAKDNNCWMLQNLKLGKSTNSLKLTQADSNVSSSGFRLYGKLADGHFTYETIEGVEYQNNSSQYYCTDTYGCYYNWYTATAGSGSSYTTSGSVNYDICPSGWTLPTGSSNGQFQILYNNYPSISQMLVDNPTNTTENVIGKIPGFLFSGFYRSEGGRAEGTHGFYWTRTAYNAQYGFYLEVGLSGIYTAYGDTKYDGNAVRCLHD